MLRVFMLKILSIHQEVLKSVKNLTKILYSNKDIDTNILTKTLKCLCGIAASNAISYAQQISYV